MSTSASKQPLLLTAGESSSGVNMEMARNEHKCPFVPFLKMVHA